MATTEQVFDVFDILRKNLEQSVKDRLEEEVFETLMCGIEARVSKAIEEEIAKVTLTRIESWNDLYRAKEHLSVDISINGEKEIEQDLLP
jgi:hypothetical protein